MKAHLKLQVSIAIHPHYDLYHFVEKPLVSKVSGKGKYPKKPSKRTSTNKETKQTLNEV